ncbi:DNA/RNA helicase domain-containing protein [Corynebacterium sp. H113]|uniref:DNA/RNA helicase domain-containing protein n=1 Tax=Corynebacterium sp. H113 TaxID=3133419 RepID=UPI0030B692AB
MDSDSKDRDDWKKFSDAKNAKMFVIGHPYFNKSLTLDVENRLMHYFTGAPNISALHNRRTNPQNRYFTQEQFDEVFSSIWRQLRSYDKKLFPTERIIKDSALFKASPFHKLTQEQIDAKREIYEAIQFSLEREGTGHLILVKGEAGAGKTVLLSSLFYELFQDQQAQGDPFAFQDLDAYLLVNHDEQLTVYEAIARKLGLVKKNDNRVSRPTRFINNNSEEHPVDVVLVDEAHLLWTQGKQSYRGKNQLVDLMKRAKVVVAVFDENQILAANQYWEPETQAKLMSTQPREITLKNQMRMDAAPETVEWVRGIVDQQFVGTLNLNANGQDSANFQVKVFDDPVELHEAVKEQASKVEHGLSRLLATFDWEYTSNHQGRTFTVDVGKLSLPWNKETERELNKTEKRAIANLAWAEQKHTVNEVGSTFTIQGFDLNFAGVIIGPSVKYRDGRVVFDPSASKNKSATNRRTLLDGSKLSVAERLLRNELNVLLTRGVHGLYIYAVDKELQRALKQATNPTYFTGSGDA